MTEETEQNSSKTMLGLGSTVAVPPPSPMCTNGDILENWMYFKLQFQNYSIATGLDTKSDQIQVATLLSIIGKDCLKVYTRLDIDATTKSTVDGIIKALDGHFEPETNVIYERFVFGSASQEPNESIDQYVCRLRHLASSCKYDTLESELIRDRIVLGVADVSLRKKLLGDGKLTLSTAIDLCRAHEATNKQFQKMSIQCEVEESIVNKTYSQGKNQSSSKKSCIYCGNFHVWKKASCPAYGKTCQSCGRPNHFAVVCQQSKHNFKKPSSHKNDKSKSAYRPTQNYSRPSTSYQSKYRVNKFKKGVHKVDDGQSTDTSENDEDSSESVYKVVGSSKTSSSKKQWFTKLDISIKGQSVTFKCQLDSGSTSNIMNLTDYDKIVCDQAPKLKPSCLKLKCYNGDLLKPIGQQNLKCAVNGKIYKLLFQIVKNKTYQKPILSAETCEKLGLLEVKADLCMVQQSTEIPWPKEEILHEFNDVFTGLGKLPGKYHLIVDPMATPVKHVPRRVPVALKNKLKIKLEELERNKIIKKESDPTDWISSMVLVVRNDKMRICLDPKDLNKALKRSHYQIPTIEEILPSLSGAKVFSCLDAKDGFWQIQLDEESSRLTTFWTPEGRYRWLRLPFGLNSAPEEFQRRLHEIVEGLDGVCVMADDILVYGCGDTYEDATRDHDVKLRRLLDKARLNHLKLNKQKLRLRQKELPYMGHILTENGLKADNSKIQAIQKMPSPLSVKELQRFLGMINYLSKFIPVLSEKCSVLRQLTKDGVPWLWDEVHEKAFVELKRQISSTPVLKYFDINLPITLQCDASETGLGCTLMQEGLPVAYASRTMSMTEQRYAQCEKELLSILFACNRFKQYICGKDNITVETDHQPLISIFKKSILSAPKRLQCMMLKLQRYNINLTYKKGEKMYIADTLSRAPEKTVKNPENNMEDWQIFQIKEEEKTFSRLGEISPIDYLNVTHERLEQIQKHTENDKELNTLKKIIIHGWPNSKDQTPFEVRPYWNVRDELSVQDAIIFRSERLVVPKRLRAEMLKRIHASHQGIDASLRKAREILYWPKMTDDIKQTVSECMACLESAASQPHMPMQTHKVPDLPWSRVALDVFHCGSEDYLVTVDYYSDFFELDKLEDLTSATVVEVTKKNFSRHGVPMTVVTDNSQAQFITSNFNKFAKEWEFDHLSSSPYHPRGNGKVESAVKIAKYLVKKTRRESQDLWLGLLEWRNTPTQGMDTSPSQRLMSRRTRTLLPMVKKLLKPEVPTNVMEKLILKKRKYKVNYDKTARHLPDLDVGVGVMVRNPSNKLHLKPKWVPGHIVNKESSRSYTVKMGGNEYRRNREFLKRTEITPAIVSERKVSTPPRLNTPTLSDTCQNTISGHGQESINPSPQETPKRTTRSGRTVKTPARYKN